MDKRIEEIKRILNAATPGPWRWLFNEHCQDIKLVTDHSGMYFVMGFGRYGMHNAQPLFQRFDRYEGPLGERGSRGMVKASELGKWAQDYRHNDGWIDHPDAALIAAAPQIVAELLDALTTQAAKFAEVERERDAAVADINAMLQVDMSDQLCHFCKMRDRDCSGGACHEHAEWRGPGRGQP